MRLMGILLLSLTPFWFGLDYVNSLKKRRDLFFSLKSFAIFTREQIRFCLRERDEIFALSDNNLQFSNDFFSIVKNGLKKGENLAKIIKEHNYIRLKPKEIIEIAAFFTELGKSDIEGEINHCDYYINLFGNIGENLSDTFTAKSRLSLSLSLSLMATMFIIMI